MAVSLPRTFLFIGWRQWDFVHTARPLSIPPRLSILVDSSAIEKKRREIQKLIYNSYHRIFFNENQFQTWLSCRR